MEANAQEFVALRNKRTGKSKEQCQEEWEGFDETKRKKQAVLIEKYIYVDAKKKADEAKAMLETYLGFKDVKICKNYTKA